jgi:hypothetical protein
VYNDAFNTGNVANMSREDKEVARKRSKEIKKVGLSATASLWPEVG